MRTDVAHLVAKVDACQLSSSRSGWLYQAQDALTERMKSDRFDLAVAHLVSTAPLHPSCAAELGEDLRSLAGAGGIMEHRPLSADLKTLKARVIQFLKYLGAYQADLVLELEKRISESSTTPLTRWFQELHDLLSRGDDTYVLMQLLIPKSYTQELSSEIWDWQRRVDDLEKQFFYVATQKESLGAEKEPLVQRFDGTYALFTSIRTQLDQIKTVVDTRDAAYGILLEEGKALRG